MWRTLRTSVQNPSVPLGTIEAPTFFSTNWDAHRDLGFHANTAVVRVRAGNVTASLNFTIPRTIIIKDAAHRVDNYLAHYSGFWGANLPFAQKHNLVLAHPSQFSATRESIRAIQQVTSRNAVFFFFFFFLIVFAQVNLFLFYFFHFCAY